MITKDTFPVLTEKTLQIECNITYEGGPNTNSYGYLDDGDVITSLSFGITIYMNGTIKKTMFTSGISKEEIRDSIHNLLWMFSDFDYTNIREDSKRWNKVIDNLYKTLHIKREEENLPINE